MPPCHHWSWSSTYVASDHFTTLSRIVFGPAATNGRDVELGRQVRVLADPDLRAVDRDDQDALGRPDVEDDPPAGPARRDLELALVDAGRVLVGDRRRQARERHLDVRVVRQVIEALHRPAARDRRPRSSPGRARRPARAAAGTATSRPGPGASPDRRGGARASAGAGHRQLRHEPRPEADGGLRHDSSCQLWAG